MAFVKENLTIMTNNVKAGVVPSVWIYYNADDDDLTTLGSIVERRMTVGDLVLNYKADYSTLSFYRVSVVTAGSGAIDCVLLTALAPDA